jgi:hypothetical protein
MYILAVSPHISTGLNMTTRGQSEPVEDCGLAITKFQYKIKQLFNVLIK